MAAIATFPTNLNPLHIIPDDQPVSPTPASAVSKPRSKKKVRMQEIIPDEDVGKPVDTFRVSISNVRARLRVAEARPVVLALAFDNYWHGETNVHTDSVEPEWAFNSATIRGIDGKQLTADGRSVDDLPPSAPRRPNIIPSVDFVYETEFGYKLHRKFLVFKLSERSPYGDVEWGTGVLPLDSIARGCPAVDVNIIAKDGVTCYGTVSCTINMLNLQRVRAHLTDLKLSDYPEAYNYDVKLIYLEFGVDGFEKGYTKCTEKRSDAEPRFSAQPALEWDTTLHNMLVSSTAETPALKIFFSVHRQVARNRTEEIGVGALPVRMLFSKVAEGWMDLPTKFKVPLANYKGVIRGKVLLRNIPQFAQLPGDDLINVDGVIMPLDVDLSSRKLLPWIKLPRSRENRSKPQSGTMANGLSKTSRESDAAFAGTVAKGLEQSDVTNSRQMRMSGVEDTKVSNAMVGQFHSPVTESASDGGSESSGAISPLPRSQAVDSREAPSKPEVSSRPKGDRHVQYMTTEEMKPVADRREEAHRGASIDTNANELPTSVSELRNRFESGGSSHLEQIRLLGALREAVAEREKNAAQARDGADVKIAGDNRENTQRQRSDESGSSRYRSSEISESVGELREGSPGVRSRRSKSGKSIGSVGTTTDGGVEIGSIVLSDDGYGTGSRTTTEDALIASHRLNIGPPSDELYDADREVNDIDAVEVVSGGHTTSSAVGVGGSDGGVEEEEEDDEWIAIHDDSTARFYFVNRYTQESLWLPPDWERMVDEDERQYFVDHGCRTTQRGFPAAEARAYRESVYAG